MANNFFQNESLNVSNLNLTNECNSLSPTNASHVLNLNTSTLLAKQNGNQKTLGAQKKKKGLSSPSEKLDHIVTSIGCKTVKNAGMIGAKGFNLRIKMKDEASFKKIKLS
eukprot:CAMPEP_0170542474 /NCGR_PEP_ID=MMETSP0211-20121228/1883_1 /TAXON_ID=311385 /ORGANISM="Pseudokeronopsis sp., Strain OXSARD2" /LENGTH=109 /DNA_ID=CAMNT_0010845539 /DNA_START=119 /DNA_END=448 /DNA_ORIENTATION=-